uniref:Uncharacterized protein n=1 Tax=Sphaerodactylus townsendi TaxID=933632 RepID=A0ACB8EDR9_9SAUR
MANKNYLDTFAGTEKSNVECSPCEPGMFSDVESHSATCRLHRTCEFELLPGNSTNDAVCKNVTPVISPRPTVKGKETSPPWLSVASSPDVNVNSMQQTPPENIAYIIGGLTTGLFIMVGVIVAVSCIVSRRKALPCKQLFGGEKQLFPSIGNGSHKWPQVSSAAKREEENLLKISPSSSGSLDHPPVLDKSSGISDLEDSRTEVEGSQQRSLPLNSCVYHCRANSKQTGSGGTHVNFSCVVNVCSSDHSLQLLSPNSSADEDALVGEDIPLSKEEIPIQRASERQSAIEVEEDSMDTLTYEEGKPVPLSIQDVGMKTR